MEFAQLGFQNCLGLGTPFSFAVRQGPSTGGGGEEAMAATTDLSRHVGTLRAGVTVGSKLAKAQNNNWGIKKKK